MVAKLTAREEYERYDKLVHREHGLPFQAPDVIHQLLGIANGYIGAVRVVTSESNKALGTDYWKSIWGDYDPNTTRNSFVAVSRSILERRVEEAVILHPDKQKAAWAFERFVNYAAGVDWSNPEDFDELSNMFDSVKDKVLNIGLAPEKRMAEIQARKEALRARQGTK